MRKLPPIVIVILLLSGCAGASENQQACETYEVAFNGAERVIREVLDGERDRSETAPALSSRVSQLRQADKLAEGEVAAVMGDSLAFAEALQINSDNEDAGTAFYFQYPDVEDACNESGASIDLLSASDLE